MTLLDILTNKPTLYGWIMVKGSQKIGTFKPKYNKYTNTIQYTYYTENGNKGLGGFSLTQGYHLLNRGQLSLDPEKGKRENYL
ncbi:MAG: hypothetical protein LBQ74_10035 [Prevotella sp.]|jgi:hypothetical protein|nr:hypothetical protein [Prevotella sp.]